MPNIILTQFCNQKCPYCFAKEQMELKKTEKDKYQFSFENFKKALNFLKKSGFKRIQILGGEPTLHPYFKKFIDYAIERDFKIKLFSNGLFSEELAYFLKNKKDKIFLVLNINHPSFYDKKTWQKINKNLFILCQDNNHSNIALVLNIYQENFNYQYIIKLAKKYSLTSILIAIANPSSSQKNIFISPQNYHSKFSKRLVKMVKKINRLGIKPRFNCGLAKNLFSQEEIKFLQQAVEDLKWGCLANKGLFDILPDLRVFRCFPLSNWKKVKLLDFKNGKEITEYFLAKMTEEQIKTGDRDFIRQGPCFGHYLAELSLK